MKTYRRRLLAAWTCLSLFASLFLRLGFATKSMEYYTSEVDGSRQPYGLYLPEPFDPDVAHPLVIFLHGWDGIASANFLPPEHRTDLANARGWILVDLDGRINTLYNGVGEKHVFDVLDELRAKHKIDERRIYLHGCSMGGIGSLLLGFRHPDIFAAVAAGDGESDYRLLTFDSRLQPLVQSQLPIDFAENGRHLALYILVDTRDTVINPEHSYRLHARLNELGYPHEYHENDGAHCEGYDAAPIYEFFSQHVNDPNPKDVLLKAKQLQHASAYWVRIDRLKEALEFATVEAKIGDRRVDVTASGLLQYTLFLTPELVGSDDVSIYTNGGLSYAGPATEVALFASLDESGNIVGWSTTDTLPRGLSKTAQIEGAYGHAYTSKFLLVTGTIGIQAERTRNTEEAQKLASTWNTVMRANISPVMDRSVTEEDIASYNLILVGTADSNSVIKAINDFLPIRIWQNRIVAGATVYDGKKYGLSMVFPNPLNPQRYVVIRHGGGAADFPEYMEYLPWLPDYLIFDRSVASYYWVDVGFFDAYWRLDKDRDGLDDVWEKDIIDADPADEITGLSDVTPEGDLDGDGLTNRQERDLGTHVWNLDSDGDKIGDPIEVGGDPANPLDTDGDGTIDALDTDSDNDGVADDDEDPNDNGQWDQGAETDWRNPDSDGDGYSDGDELTDHQSDPLQATSLPPDNDQDKVSDINDADDDNDGFTDADELTDNQSDPLDPNSVPANDNDQDKISDVNDPDDDNDGYSDADELTDNQSDPVDPNSVPTNDRDQDRISDVNDPDNDNDGYTDADELTDDQSDPLDPRSIPANDNEGDKISDVNDPDDDNDGVTDVDDPFPLDASEWLDTDKDGVGNNADPDDDRDYMPDVWESQYEGLNPLINDAEEDNDADGQTNIAEYIARTNPCDPSSVFSSKEIAIEDGQVTLKWSSVPGRVYRVWFALDLVTWFPLSGQIAAQDQGNVTEWTAAIPEVRQGYFNVEVFP